MSTWITTADQPSKARKHLPCLGCGELMWTEPGHRICKKCHRRNNRSRMGRVYRTVLPRGAWLMETPATRSMFECP